MNQRGGSRVFEVGSADMARSPGGTARRLGAVGFEKGGRTNPLEKRPAIDFKVTAGPGEK